MSAERTVLDWQSENHHQLYKLNSYINSWLLRCSGDCIPSLLHAFAHNSQFLFFAFGGQQVSTAVFDTETNRITNLDLLLPATLTWRLDVKAVHPIGARAFQHEDSGRRFYSVGSMFVSKDGSASSTSRLLTRPHRDDSSLYRIVFATHKNYGWEGYETKKQQVQSQVRETNCPIPLHP